ncbi:1-deoxy-D-xylulose-5-phosphate reductoisomerase [bacterium]|nr:1-deoxy-D-xylulose-5-phosphate reductoisomerase [bacterium]
MKRIAILGCTGSIGQQTLDVVQGFADEFCVTGLAAGSNARLLIEQADVFGPEALWLKDETDAERTRALLKSSTRPTSQVLYGGDSLERFFELSAPDIVVSAISGKAGLYPTYMALSAGLDVALANKESLVMGGQLLKRLARSNGANITPIDSEHSAIAQCLVGERMESINKLILTASGGPFRGDSIDRLAHRTFDEAQKHPVWSMGEKINVDSATLMNKGFEVIEACVLFDQPPEKVEVLVHPECIVHSMVEFVDGSIKAQLGVPDMRLPILYALSVPRRLGRPEKSASLDDLRSLRFERVDMERFRCLHLAYEAAEVGGSMPAVVCVADEVAIQHFKAGRVGFLDIAEIIERTMAQHEIVPIDSIERLLSVTQSAEKIAESQALGVIDEI